MALRNMIVRVGANITGLKQGLSQAQKNVKYFGRNVTGSMKEIRGSIGKTALTIGSALTFQSAVQDAMRFEALMATLGETLGASRKDFEDWQGTVGQSLGFSRLQSAELANTLSLNFRTIATSQADLLDKTTKMMETAAIISNKRGLTMQDVSDRIRSAMNQEADAADELGVNVRVAAIKTSTAYKELANGVEWDKLNESLRKTILYNHILEQTAKNLGTTMQDTTALRMAQFTAALADVKLALGTAFLPILYNVLPILTQLANGLYKVLMVFSAFMKALFGKSYKFSPVSSSDVANTQAQASALDDLGDSAESAGSKSASAAKKAQKAWSGTFGFDEVNTIDDPADTATGGAGGGGGGGVSGGGLAVEDTALEAPDTSPFVEAVDELAKKLRKYTKPIRDMFIKIWDEISSFAVEKFKFISDWWKTYGDTIIQAGKNIWAILSPIILAVVTYIWDNVKMFISGVIETFTGLITFLSGVFTGDFSAIWEGLKMIFFGVVKALFAFWNLSFIGGIKKVLLEFIENAVKWFLKFGDDIVKFMGKSVDEIWKWFKWCWDKIKVGLTELKQFIDGKIELMQTGFKKLWDFVASAGKKAWEGIVKVWGGIVEWFKRTVVTPLIESFQGVVDAFMEDGFLGAVIWVINKVIDGLNDVLNVFNKLADKLPFDIPNLKIPHIPKLAQGGITNGKTLAVVGDNPGGREVISPLDRLQGMLTTSVLQAMNQGGNQGSGDIVLNLDGRTFARIVKPLLDREQSRVGSDVRIRTI